MPLDLLTRVVLTEITDQLLDRSDSFRGGRYDALGPAHPEDGCVCSIQRLVAIGSSLLTQASTFEDRAVVTDCPVVRHVGVVLRGVRQVSLADLSPPACALGVRLVRNRRAFIVELDPEQLSRLGRGCRSGPAQLLTGNVVHQSLPPEGLICDR